MACFIVPATEAVITTVTTKVLKSHESRKVTNCDHLGENVHKIPFSTKLGWLNKLLCGGSVLLAFEHVWHGEVIPAFPFLTAIESGETSEMLAEMGSTGILMATLVTAVWAGMVVATTIMEKKAATDESIEGEIVG